MSNVDILGKLLVEHPDEPVLLNMLIDAIMEEKSLDRKLAARSANRIRRNGEEAKQIAEAAALIADGNTMQAALLDAICRAAQVNHAYNVTVVLVSGRARPHPNILPERTNRSFWGPWTVTVGALWLLDEVQRQCPRLMKRRRAK